MKEQIAVLIDARLHNELVIRRGETSGVSMLIEHIIGDFLERTKYDDMWSEEYLDKAMEETQIENKGLQKYGVSTKGYFWQNLFLPNGTKLKFTYKEKTYFAEIQHELLRYEGRACSPSQFVRRVANNTSRNAWRDIWIQLPRKTEWQYAEALRGLTKPRKKLIAGIDIDALVAGIDLDSSSSKSNS